MTDWPNMMSLYVADPATVMIYLASPYTHDDPRVVVQRIEILCRVDAVLMKHGIHTISPLMKHFIIDYEELPGDWAYWQKYSEKLIGRTDAIIVVCQPGWLESTGVQAEIKLGKSLGIPIIYIDENADIITGDPLEYKRS